MLTKLKTGLNYIFFFFYLGNENFYFLVVDASGSCDFVKVAGSEWSSFPASATSQDLGHLTGMHNFCLHLIRRLSPDCSY